jgi:hypothetical protein
LKNEVSGDYKITGYITVDSVEGNYYIIGHQKNSSNTMKHEMSHALFYTDRQYRLSVRRLLHRHTYVLAKLGKYLLSAGYHANSIEDEKHAYVLADKPFLQSKKLWFFGMDGLQRELARLFQKHISLLSGSDTITKDLKLSA